MPGGALLDGLRESEAGWLSPAGPPEALGDVSLVSPGDEIAVDAADGHLKGHGTLLVGGRLVATLVGAVERTNKLVVVQPTRSRYAAETGDVVLGRVVEVAGKRWKLDIDSRQDAALMLSAVALPGNVQRRRTNVDELNMRTLFQEGDLAEVQAVGNDGGAALHTRSTRYGRLSRGQLVLVPPRQVPRLKTHFCPLPTHGVELLLGCNGWVWVGLRAQAGAGEGAAAEQAAALDAASAARLDEAPDAWAETADAPVSPEERERVNRIAAAVRLLALFGRSITPAAVAEVADAALAWGVQTADIGGADFATRLRARFAEAADPME